MSCNTCRKGDSSGCVPGSPGKSSVKTIGWGRCNSVACNFKSRLPKPVKYLGDEFTQGTSKCAGVGITQPVTCTDYSQAPCSRIDHGIYQNASHGTPGATTSTLFGITPTGQVNFNLM